MIGDNILFQRADSVEAGWQAVQAVPGCVEEGGAQGLESYRPAAKARRRPTNCSSATAEAGANSVRSVASNAHRQVITVADSVALAKAAADRVMAKIAINNSRVAICLTGGSSPTELYRLLATDPFRSRIPWDRVHWFIGDERFVRADDPLN